MNESKFSFEGKGTFEINNIVKNPDFFSADIHMVFDMDKPDVIKIKWQEKCIGVFSKWDSSLNNNICLEPNWNKSVSPSRSSFCMPIQSYIDSKGLNSISVYLSDNITSCEIRSGINEEEKCMDFEIRFFPIKSVFSERYSVTVFIDKRKIPLYELIQYVCNMWNVNENIVPNAAYEPVYSTWYSFHQNVYAEELLREIKLASEYGMKTVIIDDGWQTDDCSRGYSYCGEWNVSSLKIPDIKEFVRDIHSLNMKCMLWYNVSYVGSNTDTYKMFEGKYLKEMRNSSDGSSTAVLDPRYPDVRTYIVNLYKKTLFEWKIDGFKLDFIDSFQIYEENNISDKMDYKSLDEAVCALVEEIGKKLKSINPQVLIEFRQNYVGPSMLKCANMLRVADCPGDALKNRIWGANLRLTSKNIPVHSDMIMWNTEDSAENAALQLINTIFFIPQISVKIENLPDDHKKMLKFFMDFIIKNRSVLQHGELKFYGQSANYSKLLSEKEGKTIAALYSDSLVDFEKNCRELIIVNGLGSESIVVKSDDTEKTAKIEVFSCIGERIASYEDVLLSVNALTIPMSGVAYVSLI